MSCLIGSEPPSQIIRSAMASKIYILRVEDLINAFGSHSFGLLFILIALPLLIPLPPGLGFIPATLLCILALQRVFGRSHLWFPKIIGRQRVSPKTIRKIETRALPVFERLEGYCSNRNQISVLKELEMRLASIVVVLMSSLMMLPTPFLNTIPAIITIIMGLGILNNNRRILWINMFVGFLALGLIGSTLYVGAEFLLEEISELIDMHPVLKND